MLTLSNAKLKKSEKDTPDNLPEGWEVRVDEKSGRPYYVNHKEKITTWVHPR